MKIRILFDDFKENAPLLAKAIGNDTGEHTEHVPPAFPPQGMRLIILVAEIKGGKISKNLKSFLPILSKVRCTNVAIVTCGTKQAKGQAYIKSILEPKGINVIDETYTSAGKKDKGVEPTEADVENVKVFVKKVIALVFKR